MSFVPKQTRKMVETGYKTIYLSRSLIDQIERISKDNETSFNNVVVSMIERCLEDEEGEPE